jgi:hypothetical protein
MSIKPLVEVAQELKEIGAAAVHDGEYIRVSRSAVADARAAGLGAKLAGAEDELRDIENAEAIFNQVERTLISESKLASKAALLRQAGVTPGAIEKLHEVFREFSSADWYLLIEKALRLMAEFDDPIPRMNNMAGLLREVVAKHLPNLVERTDSMLESLVDLTHGKTDLFVIDTAVHDTVELPTRRRFDAVPGVAGAGKAQRTVRLGTDRMIGIAHVKPEKVRIGAGESEVMLAGTFELHMAIEVKAITTAEGGVTQIERLLDRGSQHYAVIGGELWLLKYDPKKVVHVVIAPEGQALAVARNRAQALERAGAQSVQVLGFPVDIDQQIKRAALTFMETAVRLFGG